ncbi:hypothetical protein SNEBB_000306 [Seison nebaliae]|nr:hypothetical protein SNEBB_000306 [Seison nebaliae]
MNFLIIRRGISSTLPRLVERNEQIIYEHHKKSGLTLVHCPTVEDELIRKEKSKSQIVGSAMRSYLESRKEHEKFLEKAKDEYEIGRMNLARIMGKDVDTFTQDDIDEAINYLFPSSLEDKKARPFMREPKEIFSKTKELQFDDDGRPLNSQFYTSRQHFYTIVGEVCGELEQMKKLSDSNSQLKYLTMSKNEDIELIDKRSRWITFEELKKDYCNEEKISEKEYLTFLNILDNFLRELEMSTLNPSQQTNFFLNLMKYRVRNEEGKNELIIPEILLDGSCRYSEANGKKQNTMVKLRLYEKGDGIVRMLNGKDILLFKRLVHRQQLLAPFIITRTMNRFDVIVQRIDIRTNRLNTIDMTDDEIDVDKVQQPTSDLVIAMRHAISIGLCSFISNERIEHLRLAGMLTPDNRYRERKKFGQEGPRRKYTWLKR